MISLILLKRPSYSFLLALALNVLLSSSISTKEYDRDIEIYNTKNNKYLRSKRLVQEATCNESTCNKRSSISLRIIPHQDSLSEAEAFVTECALPNTIKKFRQARKQMFVARVCIGNILILKNNVPLIKKIQGGTKTTRSKSIRTKAKVEKEKVDCNGGCCKNCKGDKVHKVLATLAEPINNDDGLNLIKDCNVADEEPRLITHNPINGRSNNGVKYKFSICKNDKHIVKNSALISSFRRYVTRPARFPVKKTDAPTDEVMRDDYNSTNSGDDDYGDCGVDTCCKSCTTSDEMANPGEEQPPGTNVDELMNVLITVSGFEANYFLIS